MGPSAQDCAAAPRYHATHYVEAFKRSDFAAKLDYYNRNAARRRTANVNAPWRRLAVRLRDVLYLAVSTGDRLTRGTGDGLLPPWHLRKYYYGTGDPSAFARASAAARTELISRGLRPEHRVLDIGCGVGNLAVGLSDYLTGPYDGFDIHRQAVNWCQQAITPGRPNFRLHHADLSSGAYNAEGRLDASTFRFAMASGTYDVVFLGSVFTHLLPDTAGQYINEIARLLAPGGVCIASYFLLNPESRAGIEAGTSFMSFPVQHQSGLCLLHDASKPEAAVALDEAFVVGTHQRAGLRLRDIRRGAGGRGNATIRTSSQRSAWRPESVEILPDRIRLSPDDSVGRVLLHYFLDERQRLAHQDVADLGHGMFPGEARQE